MRALLATALCLLTAIPISAAEDLRERADACAARGDHAEAARCYRETADHYRRKGDEQAALVLQSLADQYEPVLSVFRTRPADRAALSFLHTGAKAEPVYGCYLGVNCARDGGVDGDFARFCDRVGKRHALLYDYSSHGHTDSHLLDLALPDGPWLQIACEIEGGLGSVAEGEALEGWARSLAGTGAPVFLRWGSEMNGDWVRWHGNPALYVQKWRLVHDAMERLAPNVVMVWCPNATPAAQIDAYYPGDGYVDWVGVNFYVVNIHDNDPKQPADHENPADLFRHVYAQYAARKPMMICETGVTHRAKALGRSDEAFAEARLGHLYGCLPRLYPRVKAICYYDVNNLQGAATGRPFNNYLVTDSDRVLAAYRQAIAPDYFLSGPQAEGDPLPHYVERLADGMTLTGKVQLSAWARSYNMTPVVQYRLDGQEIGTSSTPGTYERDLDCNSIGAGEHQLTVTLLDKPAGRVLKAVGYRVRTAPQPEAPPQIAAAPEPEPTPPVEDAAPPTPAPRAQSPRPRLPTGPLVVLGAIAVVIVTVARSLGRRRRF